MSEQQVQEEGAAVRQQATECWVNTAIWVMLIGGLGGAVALAYASRGWEGIFIDRGGRAAARTASPLSLPVRAEPQGAA